MKWFYSRGNKRFDALWDDGVLLTDDDMLSLTVSALVLDKEIVSCGVVGPDLPASLANELVAWGTISQAVRLVRTGTSGFPVCPVAPEMEMESDGGTGIWAV
jgi:hypothetical protein